MIRSFLGYTQEFSYNLKLAFPVIIGLLGHTFVQLVDNIMVGQLGTAPLAAVSLGNSFFFVAMSLGIGFSTAITPLIAEADGAKDVSKGSKIFTHGLILCCGLGLLLSLGVLLSKPLLFDMGQPEAVVVLAYPYLQWVGISLIPLIFFQGFKQFSEGLSHTRPAMYATLLGNIINIILNYFLIFGYWIFPKMGVEGAAIGSLVARCSMLLYLALYIRLSTKFKEYVNKISFRNLQIKLFKGIIKLGFPSALQMFFEVLFFTAAIWLSGILGKNTQAANQIALNLSSMTFMFAMGLGVTAMIRVGNQKGRKDSIRLREVAHSIFLLIFLFDVFFCLLFLSLNEILPWIYLDSSNTFELKDSLEVVKIASTLLIISAFFQLSDGLQAVVLGALRGLQDVNIPAGITFFAYGLIGFPIAYFLGIYTTLEATGIWIGLLSGLTASAILLFLRFRYLSTKLKFD
ncbi:MAG: MATE family efflux transporter [Flavobacteriaceae bacterium]|jgi:MATE family multidrug resistance protein|nr:MATE family efflux transporter [Flavobacteriia bacterium]